MVMIIILAHTLGRVAVGFELSPSLRIIYTFVPTVVIADKISFL
jgi:hypothetical protein